MIRYCLYSLSIFLHLWCLCCILKSKNKQPINPNNRHRHLHIGTHTHMGIHTFILMGMTVFEDMPTVATWVDFLPHCTWQIINSFYEVAHIIPLSLPSLSHHGYVLRIWNKLFHDLYFGEIGACSLQNILLCCIDNRIIKHKNQLYAQLKETVKQIEKHKMKYCITIRNHADKNKSRKNSMESISVL